MLDTGSRTRVPRLLFYCHNVQGLGHIVRSLQIAAAAADEGCECTVMTGCRALDEITIDSRLTIERLPAMRLLDDGRMVSADGRLTSREVVAARSARALDICRRVRPDAVIVDYNPLGLAGELRPTLGSAIDEGWPTRFVWGIPYLDGAFRRAQSPKNPAVFQALGKYHSAIAYVDRRYGELLADVPGWALPPRHDYMGFVVQAPLPVVSRDPGLVAVICGGGVRAAQFCGLVLAAQRLLTRSGVRFRYILGPLADADPLVPLFAQERNVEVWRTGTVRDGVRDAAICVSRAGYNTAAMLMQTDLPIVFVPALPDQASRAQRLCTERAVWRIDERPDAGEELARAIEAALHAGPITRNLEWRTDGARRAAQWAIAAANESHTGSSFTSATGNVRIEARP